MHFHEMLHVKIKTNPFFLFLLRTPFEHALISIIFIKTNIIGSLKQTDQRLLLRISVKDGICYVTIRFVKQNFFYFISIYIHEVND